MKSKGRDRKKAKKQAKKTLKDQLSIRWKLKKGWCLGSHEKKLFQDKESPLILQKLLMLQILLYKNNQLCLMVRIQGNQIEFMVQMKKEKIKNGEKEKEKKRRKGKECGRETERRTRGGGKGNKKQKMRKKRREKISQ